MWRLFTTQEEDIKWQQKNIKMSTKKVKYLVASDINYDIAVQNLIKEFSIFSGIPIRDVYGLRAKPQPEKTSRLSKIIKRIAVNREAIFAVYVSGNVYICDVEISYGRAYYLRVIHPEHLFELISNRTKTQKNENVN